MPTQKAATIKTRFVLASVQRSKRSADGSELAALSALPGLFRACAGTRPGQLRRVRQTRGERGGDARRTHVVLRARPSAGWPAVAGANEGADYARPTAGD